MSLKIYLCIGVLLLIGMFPSAVADERYDAGTWETHTDENWSVKLTERESPNRKISLSIIVFGDDLVVLIIKKACGNTEPSGIRTLSFSSKSRFVSNEGCSAISNLNQSQSKHITEATALLRSAGEIPPLAQQALLRLPWWYEAQ